MNAQSLQSQLAEISKAIEVQNFVLRDLEKQRRTLRSQLNSILDPFARLPLEISSDILLRCLPKRAAKLAPSEPPTIFLNVCHSWRSIALSTPALWACFTDETVPAAKRPELFQKWLALSGGFPLSLSIGHRARETSRFDAAALITLVEQHAHRVHRLDFFISSNLDTLTFMMPLRALRTLMLDGSGAASQSTTNILQLLLSAPNLERCHFAGVGFNIPPNADVIQPLSHLSLQHLTLSRGTAPSANTAVILRFLTLPSLHTFSMIDLDKPVSSNDVASFLSRSSPPLQSLCLCTTTTEPGPNPCLRLLPTLHSLSIGGRCSSAHQLLTDLTPCAALFPTLQHLTINGNCADALYGWEYAVVVDILETRPATLRSFEMPYMSCGEEDVPGDIRAFLGGLVRGGLRIKIGIEDFTRY
ncbi:hypothetical protein FB45DRAFT_1002706 [Roridomyces roridus]|uniref:F-box domain-containing protein n=1 Tax=Roridomyces roridus TaxID=1738132 RepID=A0AAD7C0F1_9AGAR|nr:hypothetical protein FB45DRAFT_1002706 [Roridomyces roridus]